MDYVIEIASTYILITVPGMLLKLLKSALSKTGYIEVRILDKLLYQ